MPLDTNGLCVFRSGLGARLEDREPTAGELSFTNSVVAVSSTARNLARDLSVRPPVLPTDRQPDGQD